MTYRILVVCTGNICRSPMGEVVLRARLQEAGIADLVEVSSAGVSAEEHGNPMDSRARLVLREAGYTPGEHCARQVQPADFTHYNLMLAMTRAHLGSLQRLARLNTLNPLNSSTSEIRIWNEFDTAADGPDVTDPWYASRDGFWETLGSVERGSQGIVEYVRKQIGAK